MLKLETGWAQTQGQRGYQEDNAHMQTWANGFSLNVLSDGMGGSVAGATASQEILSSFAEAFIHSEQTDINQRMNESLTRANQHLNQCVQNDPSLHGMGGTLLATAYDGASLYFLNVGDSPLWLSRAGRLNRINADHSRRAELMELVRIGQMTEEEVNVHPQRNQLTSAVMGFRVDKVDQRKLAVEPGDIFILASDGIETIPLETLEQHIEAMKVLPAQTIADNIIAQIDEIQMPHQDNATLIVLKFNQE